MSAPDHIGQRVLILRALVRCKHDRRFGYRAEIAAMVSIHKARPGDDFGDYHADALDFHRFIYRSQLDWPLGLYEPPLSRITGKPMGVAASTVLKGVRYGATDAHGNALWRNWDGSFAEPYRESFAT